MASFVWGVIGGFVAWVLTTTIAAPFYRFMSLRSEAARVLVLYEHAAERVATPDWLRQRAREYSRCGTALIAFSASTVIVARMLRSGFFFGMRFYPQSAGKSLIALADLEPRKPGSYELEDEIIAALRLSLVPSVSTATTAIRKLKTASPRQR